MYCGGVFSSVVDSIRAEVVEDACCRIAVVLGSLVSALCRVGGRCVPRAVQHCLSPNDQVCSQSQAVPVEWKHISGRECLRDQDYKGVDVLPSHEGGVVLGSSALAITAVLISEVGGGEGGSICCVHTIRMFFFPA